jgi:small subunit ribosomal protein S5
MDTTENKNITDNSGTTAVKPADTKAASVPFTRRPVFTKPVRPGQGGMNSSDRSKNPRRGGHGRPERIKPEFDQKILNIRRVTRVTKGGKRLNFSVHMVVGDKKGSVGVGTGKANDTSLAIDKAYRNAKKNIMHLNLTKNMSIPHDVSAKYCSGTVTIIPAKGRGVSAGSALKNVIELAGINDVTAKIVSPSKNKLNIARAAIIALSAFDKKRNPVAVKAETSTDMKTEVKK